MPIGATELRGVIRSRTPSWARRLGRKLPPGFRAKVMGGAPATRKTPIATSLLELAAEAGWHATNRVDEEFVRRLERRLKRRTAGHVAVLADAESKPLVNAIQRRWPGFTIRVVAPPELQATGSASSPKLPAHRSFTLDSRRHALLTAYRPFDLILDVNGDGERSRMARFKDVFFQLKKGGQFIAPTRRSTSGGEKESMAGFLARMVDLRTSDRERASARSDEGMIAEALGTVTIEDGLVAVQCTGSAMPKLRDWEVNSVLEARTGLGEVILQRPGLEFIPRGELRANHDGLRDRFAPVYQVPPHSLRCYSTVIAAPHQVLIADDVLLPDTYRHNTHPRLANRFLEDVAPRFARYTKDLTRARELAGQYFYLDSEWPRHFGHIVTEQMSRLWAWPEAKKLFPELKALIPLPGGHRELADFEVGLFTAAGIDSRDLVAPRGPVVVETMLAATPMLVNPDYIHPDVASVWRRVADSMFAAAPVRDYPEKLFSSRKPTYKRACHNIEAVEAVFRRYGFSIVYPEDFSVGEQVTMFDRARVVGGFAGSALFNLAFCSEPKQVIMISSESYTARNEYMIASVLGHHIDLIWCTPDLPQPEKGWDGKAFASGFSFDFERDGPMLEELLRAA